MGTDEHERQASKGHDEAAEGARVLLADDSKAMRRLLVKFLTEQGLRVDEAEDGDIAWGRLREAFDEKHPYDLALIDVKMPRVSGYELLRNIRMDPDLRHMPVIVITAESERDVVGRFGKLGISGYVLKPINTKSLRETVGKAIGPPGRVRPPETPPQPSQAVARQTITPPAPRRLTLPADLEKELRATVICAAKEAIQRGESTAPSPEEHPVAKAVLAWIERRGSTGQKAADEPKGTDIWV